MTHDPEKMDHSWRNDGFARREVIAQWWYYHRRTA